MEDSCARSYMESVISNGLGLGNRCWENLHAACQDEVMATFEVALQLLLVQGLLTPAFNDGEVRSALSLPLQLRVDHLCLDLGRGAFLDAPFSKLILVGTRSPCQG